MEKCSCCNPPREFKHAKSLYRHQRKHADNYVEPLARKRAERAALLSDRSCKHCNRHIPYSQDTTGHQKFCSRSCAAKSNKNRTGTGKSKLIELSCLNCAKVFAGRDFRKYCSRQCQSYHHRLTVIVPNIIQGMCSDRPTLKRYISETRGRGCQSCGGREWLGQPIPLELDHIDGNAGNNQLENLRLLCPNCHALTPTAKGKNKGLGRKSRGLPVK